MNPVVHVALAAIGFVGSHFLLSHPLRAPLVARVGERGFLLLYSLVAFATLGWLAAAYRAAPWGTPWWSVGDGLWALSTLVMLVAAILLVGSLVGNPALPSGGRPMAVPEPRGVFAITRHPMMWSFALWGVAHIAVLPNPANIVLATAIIVLALLGAAAQDAKKRRLQPDTWPEWQRRTGYWPFAALASRRIRWRAATPSPAILLAGTALWLAATWAHLPLAAMPAGIWRWF